MRHRRSYTSNHFRKLSLDQVQEIRSLGRDLPVGWSLSKKAKECIRELGLPVGRVAVICVLTGESFPEVENPFVRTPSC